MTALDILRESKEILTAGAAIIAAVKAWRADNKSRRVEKHVSEIRVMLAQQQIQKQAQNITVNVGTGGGSAKSEGTVTFSDSGEAE